MSAREAVVAEARRWLGTPFHHKARLQGVGVDCLGLVWAVGEGAGVMPPITKKQAAPFWRFYGRRPNPPEMGAALRQFLVPIRADEAGLGDICWMHWGNFIPVHMAILGEAEGRRTLIHAVLDIGVVEHSLIPERAADIYSFWRYPGVAQCA